MRVVPQMMEQGEWTDGQAGGQTDRPSNRRAGRGTSWRIDRPRDAETDKSTDRETNSKTDRQTGRKTHRQTDGETNRHSSAFSLVHVPDSFPPAATTTASSTTNRPSAAASPEPVAPALFLSLAPFSLTLWGLCLRFVYHLWPWVWVCGKQSFALFTICGTALAFNLQFWLRLNAN